MSTELTVNLGVAELRVDLSDFTSAIKSFADRAIGANEKEQARSAVKEMIAEVRKTFDTIVDTLTPLYSLTTESQYGEQFITHYRLFKAVYLKRNDLARAHCHVVRQQFEALQQRRAWMANVPMAERAYMNLKRICDEWLVNDWNIVKQMETFFQNLNNFMDDIASLSQTQGFQAFTAGLKSVEGDFSDIKMQLGELDSLGRRL